METRADIADPNMVRHVFLFGLQVAHASGPSSGPLFCPKTFWPGIKKRKKWNMMYDNEPCDVNTFLGHRSGVFSRFRAGVFPRTVHWNALVSFFFALGMNSDRNNLFTTNSLPALKIRDDTTKTIAKHADKKARAISSTPPTDDEETINLPPANLKREFASIVLADDHQSAPEILPRYYYTENHARMPTYPLSSMTDTKRAELYATNSADDYAARYSTLQTALLKHQEAAQNAKLRLSELHSDMRVLLRRYLDTERELLEARCRAQHTLQAQAELARHYKKL